MAEYDIVARALSRLGKTAGQLIPLRAESEERRARIGLTKARTEFDIEQARETRAHRGRVFAAGEREREATREERALRRPGLEAAAEKVTRERARGEQWATSVHLFGGATVKDLQHIADVWLPALKKGVGIEKIKDPEPEGPKYTMNGQPLKLWKLEENADLITDVLRATAGGRHLMETWADPLHEGDPRHEQAKRVLAGGELVIAKSNLRILHNNPPRRGSSAAAINMYTNRLKEVNAKIKRLEDIELAKIKTKGKLPTTVKFQYWDTGGKLHTQYISKGQVPAAEKQVRERGGSLQKPAKKKEVTITDYPKAAKAVAQILGQEPGEKTVEPTENQKRLIKQGLAPMGLDLVQRDRPIRKADKTWWFDPDTKTYWVIEPLEEVKAVKPPSLRQEKPGQVQRRKITRPEPGKLDPLGIR